RSDVKTEPRFQVVDPLLFRGPEGGPDPVGVRQVTALPSQRGVPAWGEGVLRLHKPDPSARVPGGGDLEARLGEFSIELEVGPAELKVEARHLLVEVHEILSGKQPGLGDAAQVG